MTDATLTASIRTERGSGPAGRLRRDGQVPAVVYGLGTDTLAVTVSARELDHILHSDTGANSLITLQVDGGDVLALARQIQRHPTRGILQHVDFIRVSRDRAVDAEVPIVIVGEAPGTKAGGKLEQQLFTVSVSALPDRIPTAIEVSIAGLALGDQIKVADIACPDGVTIALPADALVVQVAVPRGLTGTDEGEGEQSEGGESPEA
jgi:large subunit ribosomal protein L25